MAQKPPVFKTIGKSLGGSIVELYRSMGFSAIIDILWFIAYMPVILVFALCWQQARQPSDIIPSMIVFLAFYCIWNSLAASPLVTAGYALYQERKLEYPNFQMFWRLFKKFYWRSAAVNALFSAGFSLLVMNIFLAAASKMLLFMVAGMISLYILFFILMMSFYFNPLLYLDNSSKKVLRKSFLLVLDNIGMSACFLVTMGLILAVNIPFAFLFMLVYGPIMIYFTDKVFEAVFGQY